MCVTQEAFTAPPVFPPTALLHVRSKPLQAALRGETKCTTTGFYWLAKIKSV